MSQLVFRTNSVNVHRIRHPRGMNGHIILFSEKQRITEAKICLKERQCSVNQELVANVSEARQVDFRDTKSRVQTTYSM